LSPHDVTTEGLESANLPEGKKLVDMKPVVLGPGAYASPDPETQGASLLPLNEHPLGDAISEDYGADAIAAGDSAGGAATDLDEMTVEELDDTYGDEEGYPKSGNKAEKVKFAKKVEA
jgi:hypothetical protein